ncbi:MAG: type II 3-dehydroquinate dehydratase [Oscillospiraceae bacterium]|jgi:3-dehydroquinate dehydratase-2|nr:type II 3-dehydroquinate dehydratase [Oscillospiraceae bacterium]
MKKLLVINGPNINLLGLREPEIYGVRTYADLLAYIREAAGEAGAEAVCFQSNCEGAIVDEIQKARGAYCGIVINPAAYTHTSIAIPDALKAVGIPAVEVHLSDISSREEYRRHSYTTEACVATIFGKGFEGYKQAIGLLMSL